MPNILKKGGGFLCVFLNYHNDCCIGLAEIYGKNDRVNSWKEPTKNARKDKKKVVEEAKKQYRLN